MNPSQPVTHYRNFNKTLNLAVMARNGIQDARSGLMVIGKERDFATIE